VDLSPSLAPIDINPARDPLLLQMMKTSKIGICSCQGFFLAFKGFPHYCNAQSVNIIHEGRITMLDTLGSLNPVLQALIGTLFTWFLTALGSSGVFFAM
jgi:hypothetical protein